MIWEPGKSYRIMYQSESGRATERTIELLNISHAGDGRVFLKAYCHLRGEERTFRADRVTESLCLAVSSSVSPDFASPFGATIPRLPLTPAAVVASRVEPMAPSVLRPSVALVRPLVEVEHIASSSTKPRRTLGEVVGMLTGYGIAAMITVTFLDNLGILDHYSASSSHYPAASYSYAPTPGPVQPPGPRKPSLEEVTLGGRLLRTYRYAGMERHEVPSLGLETSSKIEAVTAIRVPAFFAVTGLANPALISRYLEADLNGSGELSFEELEAFQRRTSSEFRYEANEPALRPDQFLAAGGGDCEDFALHTAGLLRVWGWEPYLGTLGPVGGGVGHAVCLSFEEGSFPRAYTWFQIESWTARDGTPLKAGRSVPIDYDHVGSLSNAVSPGWKLIDVFVPETALGQRM